MSETEFDWRALPAAELERQFNPRVTVPDFQRYLDRTAAASARARATFSAARDIRYGPGERQRVDIYPVPGRVDAPAVVFVHGGFWRALSKEQFACLAEALVPRGVAAVLVGYDLCPAVTLDRIVAEIGEALAWCRASLAAHGVDPRRFHLAGSSAGAHLIAAALFRAAETPGALAGFRSAWLASGVYELEPVRAISVNAAIGLDADGAARNSPARFARRLPLPLHVVVGGDESPAWIDQSRRFAAACRAAGATVDFRVLPGENHFSLGLALPGSRLNRALVKAVAADC